MQIKYHYKRKNYNICKKHYVSNSITYTCETGIYLKVIIDGKVIACDRIISLHRQSVNYSDKDATAIRKHCHHQNHFNCTDNFMIMRNSVKNYFLQLKESLLILKLKPSLNAAKESMPLYLFENVF